MLNRTGLGLIFLLTACASPQKVSLPEDKYLWLEEIEGAKALEWVETQNKKAVGELESDPRFKKTEDEIHKIITAKDRIPYVSIRNGELFNFWQDEKNVRGVVRKTSMKEYKKKNPKWEVMLDVDALAKKENENWVYKGSDCLPPEFRYCILKLSRGGKDASVQREFDMKTKRFVENGFSLPEAKSVVTWLDQNTLLVGTDFGPGTLNDSGYPSELRIWKRATPLTEAKTLYKCEKSDVFCRGVKVFAPEGDTTLISRSITFYTNQYFKVGSDLKLTRIDVPEESEIQDVFNGHYLFLLRKAWKGAAAGDLISISEKGDVQIVAKASGRGAIQAASRSRDAIYVSQLENVTSLLDRATLKDGKWISERVPLPELGSAEIGATSNYEPQVFFRYEGYLTPSSLYLSEDGVSKPVQIKSLPERFNAKKFMVEQFEATSRDGTKIPYFLVRQRGKAAPAPALLYGYGGFEISETPYYLAGVGKAWLEKGGSYAVANIRGGGEFGPKWHQAALKENRQKSFDDFAAVAEDMIKRGFTTAKQLGIRGGSNGGLLTGAVFVQRPDLFNAVVCQVPLLDMLRYTKLLAGPSWVAEYGDPSERKIAQFWLRTSPYQNVKPDVKYPRAFISTSTKDDRVHPGHARKMVAKLMEHGHPVLYYENTEGGHSAAANLKQRARREAQAYVYLYRQLM